MDHRTKPTTRLVSLARRAGDGDRPALEKLLAAVHVHVIRYLEGWLHHSREWEESAKDLAQETLIRISATVGGFRGENDGELVTWCVTIARNIAKDRLRVVRDRADVEALKLEVGWGVTAGNSSWDNEESDLSDELRVLLRLLREAQAAEPEASQELLWRHVVLHDSWREAGDALGIPATAAKRRFQRSQERIRIALLRSVLTLPPEELSSVRRWLARADVESVENAA
jgi:RNA polymerase sigma factor (sigma-70 family)